MPLKGIMHKMPAVFRRDKDKGSAPGVPVAVMQDADVANRLETLQAVLGSYDWETFQKRVVPIYERLGERGCAESEMAQLLDNTIAAAKRRRSRRLPMGRPGTDYRRYKEPYSYALVVAMATDALLRRPESRERKPEEVARILLSESAYGRLRDDPQVWEDWLGYFERARLGGLYEVAWGETAERVSPVDLGNTASADAKPARKAPEAAGWRFVQGLKECLDEGSISFNGNEDLVQFDAKGRAFLDLRVFDAVAELKYEDLTGKKLENQFDRLNVIRRTRNNRKLHIGRSRKSAADQTGYVVQSQSALWDGEYPSGKFKIKDIDIPPRGKKA